MYMVAIVTLCIIILLLFRNICARRVIWFYRPDCGYCKRMEQEWARFESMCTTSLFPPIVVKKININDPLYKDLAENFDVMGVPHIVKIGDNYRRKVYTGDRTAGDLYSWAAAPIN